MSEKCMKCGAAFEPTSPQNNVCLSCAGNRTKPGIETREGSITNQLIESKLRQYMKTLKTWGIPLAILSGLSLLISGQIAYSITYTLVTCGGILLFIMILEGFAEIITLLRVISSKNTFAGTILGKTQEPLIEFSQEDIPAKKNLEPASKPMSPMAPIKPTMPPVLRPEKAARVTPQVTSNDNPIFKEGPIEIGNLKLEQIEPNTINILGSVINNGNKKITRVTIYTECFDISENKLGLWDFYIFDLNPGTGTPFKESVYGKTVKVKILSVEY